jgi:hypothetical protein
LRADERAAMASEYLSNYLKFLQMTARVETGIDMMDNDATGHLNREIDRFLLTVLTQHTRGAETIETEYLFFARARTRRDPAIARAERGRAQWVATTTRLRRKRSHDHASGSGSSTQVGASQPVERSRKRTPEASAAC